jgi:regulator of replication initiation timing
VIERAQSLAKTLGHVGVYESELIAGPKPEEFDIMPTAENVLFRQAEEIEAYREQLDEGANENSRLRVELQNERLARSRDRLALTDALRDAGRERAAAMLAFNKANAELNEAFQVLVAHGYAEPVEEGAEFWLPDLVCIALHRAEQTFVA